MNFYCVPKLSHRRYFVTVDAAVTLDWEDSAQFASFAVTRHRVRQHESGLRQAKLNVGGYRTADWALEVGFNVFGF